MTSYDPAGDLAPRDRVARGIVAEMSRTGGRVYLLLDHLDPAFVHRRFPMIAEACQRVGFDLARDRIPVRPAAHYIMGGVETDTRGHTSIPGQFAAGEVACTGVHGANRLASNSLLEGLVFGAAAGRAMRACVTERRHRTPQVTPRRPEPPGALPSETAIRELMWRQVGLVRVREGLAAALVTFDDWAASVDERALGSAAPARIASLVTVGQLFTRAALRRQESRGGHFRSNFPEQNDIDWSRHVADSRDEVSD